MQIELLVVPDCPNEAVAAELIATAVRDLRMAATVQRTVITTASEARQRAFTGSPTILLNGCDYFAEPEAAVGLACRLYPTPDGVAGVPSLRAVREALERAAEAG